MKFNVISVPSSKIILWNFVKNLWQSLISITLALEHFAFMLHESLCEAYWFVINLTVQSYKVLEMAAQLMHKLIRKKEDKSLCSYLFWLQIRLGKLEEFFRGTFSKSYEDNGRTCAVENIGWWYKYIYIYILHREVKWKGIWFLGVYIYICFPLNRNFIIVKMTSRRTFNQYFFISLKIYILSKRILRYESKAIFQNKTYQNSAKSSSALVNDRKF